MEFQVLTFQEKYYKWIIAFLTLIVTIASILGYIHTSNTNDGRVDAIAFLISILYALTLFAFGIYLSAMNARIEEEFFAKRKCYIEICKLYSLFHTYNDKVINYENTRSFIISHKVFTARAEGMEPKDAYIKSDCYSLKQTYLKREQSFEQAYDHLMQNFRTTVLEYAANQNFKSTVRCPQISDLDKFILESSGWLRENYAVTEGQTDEFQIFIENLFKRTKRVRFLLWFNKIALAHLNKKITQKILKYKKKLETLYGQKLLESIIQDDQQNSILIMLDTLSTTTKRMYEDISDIRNAIDSIEKDTDHKLSELADMLALVGEKVDEVLEQINN